MPDFIPVLGFADDAILTIWVLRSVARRASTNTLRQQWPGTDEGFTALCRLTGLAPTHHTPLKPDGRWQR